MSPKRMGEARERVRDYEEHKPTSLPERLAMLHHMHEGGRRDVEFNNAGGVAVAGILGGVILGLGAAWIGCSYGACLGPKIQTLMVIVGLALGGLVALVSAFFGLVIPRHVTKEPRDWGCCKGDEKR
jgi:hypothetical protein